MDDAPLPRLHVVTDDGVLARPHFLEIASGVLEAGARDLALHVRGPTTHGGTIHELVSRLIPEARRAGARLIVNDRVDVALILGGDCVHLGRCSMPAAAARALLGAGASVGVSVHAEAEVAEARNEGADYAFAGTIFTTPTHPGASGVGTEGLRRMVSAAGPLPLVAIGGVGLRALHPVMAAGAYGVAVVRAVWDRDDPVEAVSCLLAALDQRDWEKGGAE